tara:strand:- start:12031 stop:14262 length:2232 start_codon:yes stop_codon:yes gene_type:complete
MDDDFIQLIEDEPEYLQDVKVIKPWVIGIIDDEPSVHEVTKLSLKGAEFEGKPIAFFSAYSAAEGLQLIKQHPEMAVILLDVVMEFEDAGLKLVDIVRNELNNSSLQIILRTGQSGFCPEEETIIRYEINAYKSKSELTRSKLFTTLATAIRSYKQICTIKKSRDALREVINASATMMQERSVYDFSSAVLAQIDALFNISSDSLFCASNRSPNGPFAFKNKDEGFYVVAANKSYQKYFDVDICTLNTNEPVIALALKSLEQKTHVFDKNLSCLYLNTPSGWQGVIVAENEGIFQKADKELLQVFCMNVALGLENAKFFTYLNKAAFYDDITGLNNRLGLIEQSSRTLINKRKKYTLYLIDIDYFHHIISSFGYDFGNKVLIAISKTLTQLFDNTCIIARIHSDVFAVFIDEYPFTATELALRCSRPMIIEEKPIRLGLSVGVAIATNQEHNSSLDIPTLLRQAEIALHVAKENKRGAGEEFNAVLELESRKNMTILNDFRIAMTNFELFLVLQPKVNIEFNTICGFEALIRWQHPKNGLISPNAFIPIIEKSGMNYELDLYVARALCILLTENDFKRLPISFNISSNSLIHENFSLELRNVFREYNIDYSQVQIEVTENALIHSERSISRLKDLYKAGFHICLDDFGAGFSSLSYLLRLPLHTIKIDRAFVADLVSSPSSVTVLEGMLSILTKLNKNIVVEGVETDEQLELLKKLKVKVVQGFKYYKPLSIDTALKLITKSL